MKTVAIVGSARTTRELAPFEDESITIFGVNESLMFNWMKRADVMFQMHQRWSFSRPDNRSHKGYWNWLREPHEFPIYMQQAWSDIPASVKYPIEDIISKLCPQRKYFTSTIAYMMALALYQGFERIEIYGIEMAKDSEYLYQRDCVTYWVGRAEGLGVQVLFPEKCNLFKGYLYGYEGGRVIERLVFEERLKFLYLEEQEATKACNIAAGRVQALYDELSKTTGNKNLTRITKELDQAIQIERTALVKVATLSGARQETEKYLKECDELLKAAGESTTRKEYAEEI